MTVKRSVTYLVKVINEAAYFQPIYDIPTLYFVTLLKQLNTIYCYIKAVL